MTGFMIVSDTGLYLCENGLWGLNKQNARSYLTFAEAKRIADHWVSTHPASAEHMEVSVVRTKLKINLRGDRLI